MLNSNTSSTCPHNMVNVGTQMAEIGSPVWNTPANFNGFQALASLSAPAAPTSLNGGQPNFLHDVWPSRGLVHYIYIFWGSCSLMEFY